MKKVIVVGAGISGLSAAIYAQRSGFDVTLIEQHTIAGGMCTSWRRKGYLFEGAVHWLTGSNPNTALNRLWREIGTLNDEVKITNKDVFASVEWKGDTIRLYRHIEKTRKEFLRVSPEDSKIIDRLYKDVKKLAKVQMPITDIKGVKVVNPPKMGLGTHLGMLPALPVMRRLNRITCKEYAEQFQHPALRSLIKIVPEDYSADNIVFTLSNLDMDDGGYPEGGSLPMVARMADTFKSLGGTLLLGEKVERVVYEQGIVSGVQTTHKHFDANAVIITQETIAAVHQLFDVPPQDSWIRELCKSTKSTVCTFIGVGVRSQIPETPMFRPDEPIRYGGMTETELFFNNYSGYEGYAPEGGTSLTTAFMGDTYDFWKKAKDEGRYETEKQALAAQIERAIYKQYPQAAGKIEVIDIATPVTYERYTGAYHGSWMSISPPGESMKQYPGFLESIKGVYFAGHRIASPGGLPVAMITGRAAAQRVCKQFDVLFR